jgi:hypothetical protein
MRLAFGSCSIYTCITTIYITSPTTTMLPTELRESYPHGLATRVGAFITPTMLSALIISIYCHSCTPGHVASLSTPMLSTKLVS